MVFCNYIIPQKEELGTARLFFFVGAATAPRIFDIAYVPAKNCVSADHFPAFLCKERNSAGESISCFLNTAQK
jgi:hypothetical protein